MNYWTQSAENVYVAAHRGWSTKYPENTMLALKAALDLGVDQIETDIRITKDGELVLFHDPTVDRTTNGTGKVCDFTLAELQALDAGSWKGEEFAGAKVPTFIEFMEMVKDHPTLTLDLELKEYPVEGWEEVSYSVCDRVLQIVEDYGFGDRIVINTFSGKLQEYIVNKYGDRYKQHVFYPIYYMGKSVLNPYNYAYCACMFSSSGGKIASVAEFEAMRKTGVRTWAGAFVKDEETVDHAIACGVELITCNNCDVILDLLRKKGVHK